MGVNLDDAAIEARWDAMCIFVVKADAMCKFVDKAAEYGLNPSVARDLAVINTIRQQQRPLPTEYLVSTHKGIDDKKVKLTFNKRDVLFELEKYTDFEQPMNKKLQAKFFFDNAQNLTKVSYRDKCEMYFGDNTSLTIYDDAKVINLRQKQIDRESENEMTK